MPATVCVHSYPQSVRPAYIKQLLETYGTLLAFELRPGELRVQFEDDSSAFRAVSELHGRVIRSGHFQVEFDPRSPHCTAICPKCGSCGHL